MNVLSKKAHLALSMLLLLPLSGISKEIKKTYRHTQIVTVSAYNSLGSQTKKGNPALTAWGDILKPGMKAIAISRDMIKKGLKHNTEVKIEGLSGTYKVLDKMNKRWKNKIDIYMGTDVKAARTWGKKRIRIYWN